MKTILQIACFSLILISSCKQPDNPTTSTPTTKNKYLTLTGKTMGTTYMVKYEGKENYQAEIDVLLKEVNQYLSTYIPDSYITQFNKDKQGVTLPENSAKHFSRVFDMAKTVHQKSRGAFEPTIMPLVNYWGFGYTEKKPVTDTDKVKIAELMQFVDFNEVTRNGEKYYKAQPDIQLDFSALAKGYGVDVVGELLEKHNIENYLVEIGGEIRTRGKNDRGQWWLTAVNMPDPKAKLTDFKAKVSLQNSAIATSGNYRNFYEVDGVKYAHTINPKTGFPEKNTLLSASIFADDCMTADAYATACMVMGLDKAFKLISTDATLEGYFIYSDDAGEMQVKQTEGMGKFIIKH